MPLHFDRNEDRNVVITERRDRWGVAGYIVSRRHYPPCTGNCRDDGAYCLYESAYRADEERRAREASPSSQSVRPCRVEYEWEAPRRVALSMSAAECHQRGIKCWRCGTCHWVPPGGGWITKEEEAEEARRRGNR